MKIFTSFVKCKLLDYRMLINTAYMMYCVNNIIPSCEICFFLNNVCRYSITNKFVTVSAQNFGRVRVVHNMSEWHDMTMEW